MRRSFRGTDTLLDAPPPGAQAVMTPLAAQPVAQQLRHLARPLHRRQMPAGPQHVEMRVRDQLRQRQRIVGRADAVAIADPGAIRVALVQQVTGMVRWRESVLAMVDAGVTQFVEFGGKVLSPMVKRIAPDVAAISVVTMDDIADLLKTV